MTFSSGLRSILRQDPDVIMVGEIRDEETVRDEKDERETEINSFSQSNTEKKANRQFIF